MKALLLGLDEQRFLVLMIVLRQYCLNGDRSYHMIGVEKGRSVVLAIAIEERKLERSSK